MNGEAGGQTAPGDMSQSALGVAARNRFGDSTFFAGATNYQNTITPAQFLGLNNPAGQVQDGPEPALSNAAGVYARLVGDIVGGSQCFWSHTLAQWQTVQAALTSGQTNFPQNTGAPACYNSVAGMGPQIVIVGSVGQSTRGGVFAGAPAFLFTRPRNINPNNGPVPSAVVSVN